MIDDQQAGSLQSYGDRPADLTRRPRTREALIQGFLFICGAISILTTVGIVYELGKESLGFFTSDNWHDSNKALVHDIDAELTSLEFTSSGATIEAGKVIRVDAEIMEIVALSGDQAEVIRAQQGTEPAAHLADAPIHAANRVSLLEFFTGTDWNPQLGRFGILPLVSATLMTSFIAMLVALPLGLSAAIYLSEYATARARRTLKPILEVLAGVPTVVYGYFALSFMTPLLRQLLGIDRVEIYNTASAGLVIGVLIIPLVSSMSEDALSAVPRSMREAAYGLGATKLETALKVVFPAALSGITAAVIVAISRAIGETMIVAIAAGAGAAMAFNPLQAAETMTGHIVRISGGDISYDSIDYNSIFAIGMLLFIMTLALNILSQRIVRRFREVYD